ncbi:MAG TPA: hypothetical protein VKN14_03255 [Flavobacteriaceae bacterium]|nr:hypothetical protein [Flavobacteriaceae bacterium]
MILKFSGILILLLTLIGCKDSKVKTVESDKAITKSESSCIKKVFEKDSIFGEIRNHASKTISLSETIVNYTQDLKSLDFSNCPKDFKIAFDKHIEAWLDIRTVIDKYPSMHGELHDIFDELEKSKDSIMFKQLLGNIWETWKLVEQSAN